MQRRKHHDALSYKDHALWNFMVLGVSVVLLLGIFFLSVGLRLCEKGRLLWRKQ